MTNELKDPNPPAEIREYIYSNVKGHRTKTGMIVAFRLLNSGGIFISWSKFNYKKEQKPFQPNLMYSIAYNRYIDWLSGFTTKKKVPVSMQKHMDKFIERCKFQYPGYIINMFGTYAEITPTRLKQAELEDIFNIL